MSTCQKKHDFMSTCQKTWLHVFLSKNMFFMSSYLKTCSSCLLTKKHVLHVFLSKNMASCLLVKKTWLHVNHANIVQMVKSYYKIKIYSRESKSRFYGVLLSKQHQCLTIVPLLQYNSGTIRV